MVKYINTANINTLKSILFKYAMIRTSYLIAGGVISSYFAFSGDIF